MRKMFRTRVVALSTIGLVGCGVAGRRRSREGL